MNRHEDFDGVASGGGQGGHAGTAFADGVRTPVVGPAVPTDLEELVAEQFPHWGEVARHELVEFVEEHGGMGGSAGARGGLEQQVRVKVQTLKDQLERGLILAQQYEKSGGSGELVRRCLWLLLELHTAAGAESLEGLVKLMHGNCTTESVSGTKARVNKCLKMLQENIPELPRLPEQRDDAARANMSAAQKIIWKGKPAARV